MKKLTLSEIAMLCNHFPQQDFSSDFHFVYEKHVPQAGLLLVEGQISLLKKNKVVEDLDSGHLLGVYHLLNNEPVKVACRVKKNSKAILFDRSTIVEVFSNPQSPFISILK